MLIPKHRLDAFRAQPEVAVGRLGNRSDKPFGKALAGLPRRVRVLTDVERGIERENARAPRQQHASQHNARRDRTSFSSVYSAHSAKILYQILACHHSHG